MKSGARVLLVYGSETNVTKGFVDNVIAKEWRQKNDIQLDIEKGDDIADRWDEVTHENYDYIFVATSSYAEGDPPTGFGRFLYRLQETTKEFDGNATNVKPLYGMQHAVLGVGNTQYDTFQNIPRHVDKYLGQCGSRRCKQRLEWDEMEDSESDVQKWASEMIRVVLESNPDDKDKPEVCAWDQPGSDLFEKNVGEDGWEDLGRTQTEIGSGMMIFGFLVIVAGALYQKYPDECLDFVRGIIWEDAN